jgi:hypothetical protein
VIVACVLRSGGHYDVEYVERLYRDVRWHTPAARFVCLSDVDVPCERIPLIHDWPGWWAKIELFRPGLFHGPVLYLDLDSLVVGDVTPLFRKRFTALADFYRPSSGIGSGVMAWEGDMSHLYHTFRETPDIWQNHCTSRECWGDQGFIALHQQADKFQQLLPDLVQSVKLRAPRAKARVLCFHGRPKPRDVNWRAPSGVYTVRSRA